MLASAVEPIRKVGAKIFVSTKLVEEIQSRLMGLPEKQKSQIEIKEAVAVLYQEIQSAFQKNYTAEEITELFQSAGWAFTDNSLKYFWRLFRIEGRNSKDKKIAPPKATGKKHGHTQKNKVAVQATSETSSDTTEINIPKKEDKKQDNSLDASGENGNTQRDSFMETKTATSPRVEPEKALEKAPGKMGLTSLDVSGENADTSQNRAHFELTPDTDDL